MGRQASLPVNGQVKRKRNRETECDGMGKGGGGASHQLNEQAKKKRNNTTGSIGVVITTRKIGSIKADHPQPEPNTRAYNECDTNADTSCLGTNFIILN